MAPAHYFASHYYERVLTGVTTLLVENGLLDRDELERRSGGIFPLALPVADHPMVDLPAQPTARFAVGDRVRVKDFHPRGHTRAPGFCRGKRGTVLHVAPPFPFPDASAHGGNQRDEHTYHVEFSGGELWGADAEQNGSVVVDLWDSYLEGDKA
jgi:nitrile hydratase